MTAFENVSDGIEMACCHIRVKVGLYRRGPVQFLPDLMSMELQFGWSKMKVLSQSYYVSRYASRQNRGRNMKRAIT